MPGSDGRQESLSRGYFHSFFPLENRDVTSCLVSHLNQALGTLVPSMGTVDLDLHCKTNVYCLEEMRGRMLNCFLAKTES